MFIKKIEIDWDKIAQDSYLREIPALKEVEELSFCIPVTYFVGENGSGKSTLLEAIAIAAGFNPEGGTKNYNFSTYDSHSQLHEAIRLVRNPGKEKWGYFLRAESFYNVATMEEEYAKEGPVPSSEYHKMSHGESFLEMALKNMERVGLYFLDEPEAALSPQRQFSLLSLMHESIQQGSQFIIVSHSPILLGYPEAEIISFDEGQVHPIAYEDTDSYKLTKMFLENRKQILSQLLSEDAFVED